MKRLLATVVALSLALSAGPGTASAHANLVSASIRNNQVFPAAHPPVRIVGTFAEPLNPDPSSTWMQLFEGQADHGLVSEKQKSVVSYGNPKQMTLAFPHLGKEKYYVIWHTKSSLDGHIAAGILYFAVK